MLIASQHKKEDVLSPLLTAALGVTPVICQALDTDQLRTLKKIPKNKSEEDPVYCDYCNP